MNNLYLRNIKGKKKKVKIMDILFEITREPIVITVIAFVTLFLIGIAIGYLVEKILIEGG
jgi:hypothetical protein